MTREEELASLRAKLASSQGMGDGYKERIAAIEARIAELEGSDGI